MITNFCNKGIFFVSLSAREQFLSVLLRWSSLNYTVSCQFCAKSGAGRHLVYQIIAVPQLSRDSSFLSAETYTLITGYFKALLLIREKKVFAILCPFSTRHSTLKTIKPLAQLRGSSSFRFHPLVHPPCPLTNVCHFRVETPEVNCRSTGIIAIFSESR